VLDDVAVLAAQPFQSSRSGPGEGGKPGFQQLRLALITTSSTPAWLASPTRACLRGSVPGSMRLPVRADGFSPAGQGRCAPWRRVPFCAEHRVDLAGGQIEQCSAAGNLCLAISASISTAVLSSSPTGRRSCSAPPAAPGWRLHRGNVVAPDFNVGLGDAGVGRQQEQHRMGAGQHVERQFGLGADGVPSPGVSRMTRPCFKSGCGKLISAWRQRGNRNAAVARQAARRFPRRQD